MNCYKDAITHCLLNVFKINTYNRPNRNTNQKQGKHTPPYIAPLSVSIRKNTIQYDTHDMNCYRDTITHCLLGFQDSPVAILYKYNTSYFKCNTLCEKIFLSLLNTSITHPAFVLAKLDSA